jgi:phage gp36-like protein
MAYITQSDIEEQLAESELIQLTDDAGAGQVDTVVVARAIADADDEINSYLQERYTVPLSTTPGLVRKLSVDLAIYNLFSRRDLEVPVRTQRYENAVRLLRALARGEASLGVEAPPVEAHDEDVQMTRKKGDRIFTRRKSASGGDTSGTLNNF